MTASPTVGLYVHIPFCERVCPYCDFAVVAARKSAADIEARYVAAVVREIEARASAFEGARLETISFGGGTPSVLDANQLGQLRLDHDSGLSSRGPLPGPLSAT